MACTSLPVLLDGDRTLVSWHWLGQRDELSGTGTPKTLKPTQYSSGRPGSEHFQELGVE